MQKFTWEFLFCMEVKSRGISRFIVNKDVPVTSEGDLPPQILSLV